MAIRKLGTVIKRITAWSFSRWRDYEKCPALAKYKHVDRIKEPDTGVTDHGTKVHELAEKYVTGKLKDLPLDLVAFKKEFNKLRSQDVMAEQEWAFNEQWERVDWFAKDAWLRIKVDAHFVTSEGSAAKRTTTVHIIDHKTGKIREEHIMQRDLYALGAFLIYPDATQVVAKHWYLDHSEEHSSTYRRDQLDKLKADWLKRTKPMLNDTMFAPRPSRGCQWCYFRKQNGGPCRF